MREQTASLLPEPHIPPHRIAGIDEAGRGCLAGPVVACALILPEEYDLPGLTDSKKLSAAKRRVLAAAIKEQAVCWSLGLSWAPEIDRVNILQATFLAMSRAAARLSSGADFLLVDGDKTIPAHLLDPDMDQRSVVGGDLIVPAISAASILAKTWRDHLVKKLDKRYPGYGLAGHKGYGTAEHLEALRRIGPSPIHRLTFRGVLPRSGKKERQSCLPGI